MGNLARRRKKIQKLIAEMKKEIPLSDSFELGDNDQKLNELDRQLKELYDSIGALRESFSSRSLRETNPYLQARNITEQTQTFINKVRRNGKASTENTRIFLTFMRELESATENLFTSSDFHLTSAIAETREKKPNNDLSKRIRSEENKFTHEEKKHTMEIYAQETILPPNKKPSILANAAMMIVSFPKPLGRFIFDTLKYEKAVDSSAIIMGWIVIFIVILIFRGVIPMEAILNTLRGK